MSMRAAINAFCRDCIHDPLEPGSWRAQVAACTSSDCALFKLRPMPSKQGPRKSIQGQIGPVSDPTSGGAEQ
jgi:hypothetical protein